MSKLVIPGFPEVEFTNQLIRANENINEVMGLENCDAQVFFLSFKPGDVRPTHAHEEMRLTVVRSGKMRLTFEGKTIEASAGDVVLLLSKVPHSLEVLGDEPLTLMELVLSPAGHKLSR